MSAACSAAEPERAAWQQHRHDGSGRRNESTIGQMTQHIGIVACSAEGAALCYRTICIEGAQRLGTHAHPEVTLHTHSLAAYMACIYENDWQGVAELMLASAEE